MTLVFKKTQWTNTSRQGAVRGGKVRTILRARRWEGAPEGETWFLPRGTLEPCISAWPRPGFDRANFHVIVQTRAGPRACFRLLFMLYFRHPSISDEKNCRTGGNNRNRVATVKSGSTVLVSSSSREPSAQLKSSASNTRNKACHKAPAK